MRRIAGVAFLWILPALNCGCGTAQSVSIGELSPFAGTKLDTWIAENYPSDRALAVLDWPFSLIADVALLPVSALFYPYAVLGRDEGRWTYGTAP